MVHADEIRKGNGQIQFSLTVLKTTQLQPKLKLSNAKPAPSFMRNGNSLSASQVLVGSLSDIRITGNDNGPKELMATTESGKKVRYVLKNGHFEEVLGPKSPKFAEAFEKLNAAY